MRPAVCIRGKSVGVDAGPGNASGILTSSQAPLAQKMGESVLKSVETSAYSLSVVLKDPRPLLYHPQRQFYTYNDCVEGQVLLEVTKDVAVKNIQVKVCGMSQCTVARESRYYDGNQWRTEKETDTVNHEVLYDVETVFPPHNVVDVAVADKFTLTKGKYQYGFSLRIPTLAHCGDEDTRLHSNRFTSSYERPDDEGKHWTDRSLRHLQAPLPPNFSAGWGNGDHALITYQLKVSVHRAGMFASTGRLVVPIDIRPPGPPLDHYISRIALSRFSQTKLIDTIYQGEQALSKRQRMKDWFRNTEKRPPTKLRLKLFTKPLIVPSMHNFQLYLLTSHALGDFMKEVPVIFLRYLEITLVQKVDLWARTFNDTFFHNNVLVKSSESREILMVDAVSVKDEGMFKSQIDLSHLLNEVNLESIPPSFTTCNIGVTYDLKVAMKFSSSSDSWFSDIESFEMLVGVTVAGPLVEAGELSSEPLELAEDVPQAQFMGTVKEQGDGLIRTGTNCSKWSSGYNEKDKSPPPAYEV